MTPEMWQAITGLAYSSVGFGMGYLTGKMGSRMTESARWAKVRPWIGILILLLVVYTVVTGIRSAAHDREASACQTHINQEFRKALIERSDAATTERTAQRELLLSTIDPVATPDTKKDAVRRYLSRLDASDSQRDAAPLEQNGQCG